jgi:short-subunit dehydrogenase
MAPRGPDLPLRGVTCLLTGASRGIGALTARRLCALGAHVIGAARSREPLEALRAEVEALGVGRLSVEVVDLSDEGATVAWAVDLAARCERIDAVVHNAGVDDFQPSDLASPEDIGAQVRLNLTAPALINRALLPRLLARDAGALIHMSSAAGYVPTPFGAVYSATKAGLWAYSESLAVEYAHTRLRFVTIHPSFVHGSGMHERHKERAGRAPALLGFTTDEAVAEAVARCLLRGERLRSGPVIVNRGLTRPFVLLIHLWPSLARWLSTRLVRPYLSRVAGAHATRAISGENTKQTSKSG